MLFLFQAVAQQIPPIFVTVQPPAGMPEWERAAIAAGIGAFFAVVASISMELAKPQIAAWLLKGRIMKHIDQEFRQNYADLLAVLQIIEWYASAPDERKKWACEVAETIHDTIASKRLDYFRAEHIEAFHELKEANRVAKFNVIFKSGMALFPRHASTLRVAEVLARKYAADRKMPPVEPNTTYLNLIQEAPIRLFFKPVQFYLQPTDLLIERFLPRFRGLPLPGPSVVKKLGKLLYRRLPPFSDLNRMHLELRTQLAQRFFAPDRLHSHPRFEGRSVLFSRRRHLLLLCVNDSPNSNLLPCLKSRDNYSA